MNDLIRDELDQVLADWHSGKEVRSIALGHSTRQVETYGVLSEERHVFRQKKTLECVFQIIATFVREPDFLDFQAFQGVAQEIARGLQLSAEEEGAAISLAWTALHRGWSRALVGFPEHQSITLKREAEA